MCEFFSFLSDGKGSYIYADAKTRKDNPGKDHDSHTWLAQHFLGKGASKLEDLYNKYEYNPFTRNLRFDTRGQKCEDDYVSAEKWCNELNFKRIVPELKVKKIENPLTGNPKKVTPKDIDNLKKWSSVWKIISNKSDTDIGFEYVGISISKCVCNSISNSLKCSAWNKIDDSFADYILNYLASFIDIKYDFDITPGNALLKRGFVPSFDGTTWRLHSGKDAKVVYKMKA